MLKQIKLTGNRRPTVSHSGGGHSLEILPRAPEIIDPPLLLTLLRRVLVFPLIPYTQTHKYFAVHHPLYFI